MTKSRSAADKWIAEGIQEHLGFLKAFASAKERALNAGYYFHQAQRCCANGEWELALESNSSKIPARTIRYYIAFVADAIEWVRHEHPQITNADKILEAARAMVIQSPKGLIALCRDLSLMRKFGEYDELRYAINKRKIGEPQLVLNFHYEEALENLRNFDVAPNAKNLSDNALNTLAAQCDTTAECCRALLAKKHQQRSKTLQLLDA